MKSAKMRTYNILLEHCMNIWEKIILKFFMIHPCYVFSTRKIHWFRKIKKKSPKQSPRTKISQSA